MEKISREKQEINGWGIDANPENEPNYPIKHYTGDDHQRLNYDRPQQQPVDVEILQSNERPYVTAVFGTSVPPSGLSGRLRRFAFNYSEGSSKHWMTLILADRINVIEGIIDDLKKGYIPNIFAERGWKAEWKHNPKGLVTKIAATAVISYVAFKLLFGKKK